MKKVLLPRGQDILVIRTFQNLHQDRNVAMVHGPVVTENNIILYFAFILHQKPYIIGTIGRMPKRGH